MRKKITLIGAGQIGGTLAHLIAYDLKSAVLKMVHPSRQARIGAPATQTATEKQSGTHAATVFERI